MILTKEKISSLNIDDLIEQKIKSGTGNSLLHIVPTNRKVRELTRNLISSGSSKVASSIKIETLGTLTNKLLRNSANFIELSEASGIIFLKQIIPGLKLKYFSEYEGDIPFGTLEELNNAVNEYKRHGLTPDDLRKIAMEDDLSVSERTKAADLAEIYKAVIRKCDEFKSFSEGDIYRHLLSLDIDEFNKSSKMLFSGIDTILVYGFDEFSNPEIEIVNRLADLNETKLYINFDYRKNNMYLFGHLEKCSFSLEVKGFKRIEDLSAETSGTFRETLRSRLFSKFDSGIISHFKDEIRITSTPSKDAEVKYIAGEIKKILLNGADPSEVCVVFNNISEYSPLVRDVFGFYEIPLNLTDREYLQNSPSVNTLISFLEVRNNDFYYKSVIKALSGGLHSIKADTANLSEIASKLRIVAGENVWLKRIKDEYDYLKYEQEDWLRNTSEIKLNKAKRDIETLIELLNDFTGELTVKEFLKKLDNLCYKLRIHKNILELKGESAERSITGLTKFFETIIEVFTLLEEEYGTDRKFGLDFFLGQLKTISQWSRYNIKEKHGYGVLVTSVNELRGLHFHYLFIGGMNDGVFPMRYKPEIFRPGSYARGEAYHFAEEKYRFYQALCAREKSLFLTYPELIDNKDAVQSVFIKYFKKLFEVSEPILINNEIFTKEELIQIFGNTGNEELLKKSGLDLDKSEIQHAIEIENFRNDHGFDLSGYTGGLEKDKLNNDASKYLDDLLEREYSVSQLETYAKCPFKYFIERILHISSPVEPTEELEAPEIGTIIHSILYSFYTVLREKNIKLNKCSDDVFELCNDIIFDIAEKKLEEFSFISPLSFYDKEKLTGINGNKTDSILYKFLEHERNDDSGFTPAYFEVSFGTTSKAETDELLSKGEPVLFNGIKLKGKIDRIDLRAADGSFRIIDYKTGGKNKKPTKNDVWDGLSFQLPVYLKIGEELIGSKENKKYEANDMAIYALKYSEDDFGIHSVNIERKKEGLGLPELLQEIGNMIKNAVEDISSGKFNLTTLTNPEAKICRYCEFKSVCRISDTGEFV